MLVGVFDVRETPASTMSASSQFSQPIAVVMGDGELDRVDPREIGGVQRVLAPGPRLGLAGRARSSSASITGSSAGDGGRPSARQRSSSRRARLVVDQGVEHQARDWRRYRRGSGRDAASSAPSARNGGSPRHRRTGRAPPWRSSPASRRSNPTAGGGGARHRHAESGLWTSIGINHGRKPRTSFERRDSVPTAGRFGRSLSTGRRSYRTGWG